MSEEFGIKEVLEMVKMLKVTNGIVGSIMADGKIDMMDLPHVMTLAGNATVFKDGVSGLSKIKDEITNLSKEELGQLIGALIDAGYEFEKKRKGL